MQRNIQQITQQFVDRLPENDQCYRLDELRSWGFPAFLVKRIKIELKRNLEESLIIPKTDWANTQSDAVQNAWQKFVDAIQAEARLPASYGKTVIETAVADIVEMLVQPRKNIPEVVFGKEDQLSYDLLCEQVKSVVVYPHFAKLVPRYMQKKELNKLSKDRCRKIVSKADEKLTARYSPLNWAQMLEPLFKLLDGEIDTNLLRLFFEDKNKPRIARKFDLMNDLLTRAELIEVLSSPELLNFEGYEDDQSRLFEDQPVSEPSEQEPSGSKSSGRVSKRQKTKKQELSEEKASNEVNKESGPPVDTGNQEDKNESVEEEDENTLNSAFVQEDDRVDEADEEAVPLNAFFKDQNYEEIEKDEIAEDLAKLSKGDLSYEDAESQDEQKNEKQSIVESDNEKREQESDEIEQAQSGEIAPQENGQDQLSDEQEEIPIWMRYMSDEEIEEYEKKQKEEEEDETDEIEEGFIDDPIIDLTNEDASEQEIETLRNKLSGDRERFVEEIFRGSERAFDEAIENIAAYNNWREATKYVEKEIFKRNLVDVYSEAAVSFTDQLQNYFSGK
jgi:hypothetical protein